GGRPLDDVTAPVPSGSTPATSDPAPTPTPTPAPAPSLPTAAPGAPVTAVVTTTPVTATEAGPAAQAVAAQVFPETARLVGSGEGVHRIVLQLNPKALGEVRIVLTVRAGDVQVRFAAGDEARVALMQTSPDLHRLLEQAGAQSAHVEVRDPSGAASSSTSSSWSSSQGSTADTAGGSAQGQPRTQDHHHPGTGSGQIATDGIHLTARRAVRPGAGLPFDHASGVDLTM
ncbi:MAG: flagellar hook-length control protein FliK, partial [Actinomycetota bacterium]|nr:flagellar hook-length control protein FliK [Actinomycetota bacterium]